jgi:hypothetical protein
VAVIMETCARNSALFLGMVEVEEKYILGSFMLGSFILGSFILGSFVLGSYMIMSSRDVLLLSNGGACNC